MCGSREHSMFQQLSCQHLFIRPESIGYMKLNAAIWGLWDLSTEEWGGSPLFVYPDTVDEDDIVTCQQPPLRGRVKQFLAVTGYKSLKYLE